MQLIFDQLIFDKNKFYGLSLNIDDSMYKLYQAVENNKKYVDLINKNTSLLEQNMNKISEKLSHFSSIIGKCKNSFESLSIDLTNDMNSSTEKFSSSSNNLLHDMNSGVKKKTVFNSEVSSDLNSFCADSFNNHASYSRSLLQKSANSFAKNNAQSSSNQQYNSDNMGNKFIDKDGWKTEQRNLRIQRRPPRTQEIGRSF